MIKLSTLDNTASLIRTKVQDKMQLGLVRQVKTQRFAQVYIRKRLMKKRHFQYIYWKEATNSGVRPWMAEANRFEPPSLVKYQASKFILMS